MKDSKMHQGHRQRLKDRARKNGLADFNKYEALELILTYPIMFKDTNEIAHRLLDTYGTFANIVNAPREDLKKNNGIGEEASLFLNLIKDISKFYIESKNEGTESLNSMLKCVNFFRESVGLANVEEVYIIFTDAKYRFVKIQYMARGDDSKTCLSKDNLRNVMATVKAKNVVLIHTHPNGEAYPSAADYDATKSVENMCKLLGFDFLDHIVVGQNESFSFRENSLIEGDKGSSNKKTEKKTPKIHYSNVFEDILHRKKDKSDK